MNIENEIKYSILECEYVTIKAGGCLYGRNSKDTGNRNKQF